MDSLDKRVSRILGQMKGIQKMVKEQRDYSEILQQIASVKKAIDGCTKEILLKYAREAIPSEKSQQFEKILQQVIDL